jgi:hypothetical protein
VWELFFFFFLSDLFYLPSHVRSMHRLHSPNLATFPAFATHVSCPALPGLSVKYVGGCKMGRIGRGRPVPIRNPSVNQSPSCIASYRFFLGEWLQLQTGRWVKSTKHIRDNSKQKSSMPLACSAVSNLVVIRHSGSHRFRSTRTLYYWRVLLH